MPVGQTQEPGTPNFVDRVSHARKAAASRRTPSLVHSFQPALTKPSGLPFALNTWQHRPAVRARHRRQCHHQPRASIRERHRHYRAQVFGSRHGCLLLGSGPQTDADIDLGAKQRLDQPVRRPVLQVFSAKGRPLGFVKAGWNEWTRTVCAVKQQPCAHARPGRRSSASPALGFVRLA